LNDKPLKRKLEEERKLEDGDELSFEEKGRSKKPIFVIAALLALAVTGGLFAYTWTTATATLDVSPASSDFASVTANTTGITAITWTPFGRYRGTIPAGTLFNITPASGYNGDLEVTVYLANPDELSENYRAWLLRLELWDDGDNPVDAQEDTQVLSLDNGEATFYWPSSNYTPGDIYYIRAIGGSYVGLPWVGTGWSNTYDPLLFVQVTQAGLKGTP
jgi:hypothetical protein